MKAKEGGSPNYSMAARNTPGKIITKIPLYRCILAATFPFYFVLATLDTFMKYNHKTIIGTIAVVIFFFCI